MRKHTFLVVFVFAFSLTTCKDDDGGGSEAEGAESTKQALHVSWADYSPSNPTWANPAPTVTAGAVTVSGKGGAALTDSDYSLSYEVVAAETTNNSCSLASGTSPALTINGVGTCVVKVTATDANGGDDADYADGSAKVTLTIGKGDQMDITGWTNPYGSGTPALAPDGSSTLSISGSPTPAANGAGISVEYQDGGSDAGACSVATDGTVTAGSTAGTCIIEARYKDSTNYGASSGWYEILNIEVGAPTLTGIAWDAGNASRAVGNSGQLNTPTGAEPTDTVSYVYLAGPCSFGSGSDVAERTLTFNGVGNCEVKVTVERSGHAVWHSERNTYTATESPGLSAITDTTYLAQYPQHSYDTSIIRPILGVGESLDLVAAPDGGYTQVYIGLHRDGTTPSERVSVTYTSWSGVGLDSNDSLKADVCSVDSNGRVTSGSAAVWGDQCLVLGTINYAGDQDNNPGAGSNYAAATYVHQVADILFRNAQSAPGVGQHYPATATAFANVTTTPSGGDNSGTGYGTLQYRTTAESTVCSVGLNSDFVLITDDSNPCPVEVRWSGNSEYAPSPWVSAGTIN